MEEEIALDEEGREVELQEETAPALAETELDSPASSEETESPGPAAEGSEESAAADQPDSQPPPTVSVMSSEDPLAVASLETTFTDADGQVLAVLVLEARKDQDGDGVHDKIDACVDEAEDADQSQDEDGCPDLDNDHDGVPDTEDACPLQSGPLTLPSRAVRRAQQMTTATGSSTPEIAALTTPKTSTATSTRTAAARRRVRPAGGSARPSRCDSSRTATETASRTPTTPAPTTSRTRTPSRTWTAAPRVTTTATASSTPTTPARWPRGGAGRPDENAFIDLDDGIPDPEDQCPHEPESVMTTRMRTAVPMRSPSP